MKNPPRFLMCISLAVILAVVMVVGGVSSVQAAEFPGGGTIPAGQTINDDVFLSSQNVTVDGTVNGMLIAGGTNIIINGTVNGDALLMGGMVTISEKGSINGNLFMAGTSLQVNGKVTGSVFGGSRDMTVGPSASIARNMYYGGYSLETKSGSLDSTDVFMGGYQAILSGNIGRDLNFAGGALQLNGNVGRNVTVDIGAPSEQSMNFMGMSFFQQPGVPPMPEAIPSGLHISSTATIGGKLTYTSEVEQANAIQAQPAGGIVYQTPVPQEQPEAKPQPVTTRFPFLRWLFNQARSFVTLLILGALALWLLPSLFQRIVVQAETKPLPAAGFGCLTVIVGYAGFLFALLLVLLVAVIIFIISLGGLGRAFLGISLSSLGALFAAFTLLVTYGSKLIVAYLIGDLLMRKVSPQASHFRIWAFLLGLVIFSLVYAIPGFGWLIGVAATLVGLGAMLLVYLNSRTPTTAPVVQDTP
jgi:cytoskeletal protein CcmA (bactofilin family)